MTPRTGHLSRGASTLNTILVPRVGLIRPRAAGLDVMTSSESSLPSLHILALTQALWGERIADTVRRLSPPHWSVALHALPRVIPPVIDDPEDFLPAQLPQADLLLALGETPGAATLIPDVARLCGARAVIAPIDRNESLPAGLVRQVRGWLNEQGVAIVFPKPLCSLTETTVNGGPILERYDHPLISAFAARFGAPRFKVAVDVDRVIQSVDVERDSACGCARHVADGLIGCPAADADLRAGLLHHHYPCLASMNQDDDYRDTLMHVSGHILRQAVKAQVREHVDVAMLRPGGRVDAEGLS